MILSENALTILNDRYLLRDSEGNIIEEADELLWRVACAVASAEEGLENQCSWAEKFESLLSNLDFLPNTPTLMNAGKEKGQLSACFVLPIEDSMEGIFTSLKDAAIIHQTGGGTGFDFSRLRPKGSTVSNKSGVSTGPLSFAGVYNSATDAIKQGASRRGANMMNLRVDHPDILEFIDMKMTPGVMTNFNVSVTITNEFMEALDRNGTYKLHHPFTGVVGELDAKSVWDRIARNAWRSAEPGIVFIDRVNERSPYWERIEATNPCGEQPLPPYGSCNLGSINLSNFADDGKVDWLRLAEVTRYAVRFLDNVIDVNVYPLEAIEKHTKAYRNIGLGVMGWADLLIKLKLSYNSKEAVVLAEKLMEFINKVAHEYSFELAQEKGLPEAGPFKTFYEYSSAKRRNATLTTVAPTGTLSRLANCSSGVEPNFSFAYDSYILDKIITQYHPLYKKAKENGGVDKGIFVESSDVPVDQHVYMQAAFQKHCDSAISKTINLAKSATVEDVQDAYIAAWRNGCKGITVYRDGSREGVLHKIESQDDDSCCETPDILKESGCETCRNCGVSKCLMA